MRALRFLLERLRGGSGDTTERGNAIVEFGFLALLFMVPLVYLMLAVFDVQKAMYASSAAARDAGRAYNLQETVGAAEAAARQAAAVAFRDQGLDGFNPNENVDIDCDPACLQPGSVVSVTVGYRVDLPFTGFLGDVQPSIRVDSTHITPYGEYRQGGG